MLESFYLQRDLSCVDYELIVVDNNSTDDTRRVADGFSNRPGFCYFLESRQGLSFARNRGITEARGDVVSFLDDDVIVDSRWLANLQKCLDETHADVVGGRVELNFQASPPTWLGPLFRMYLAELDLAPTRMIGLDHSGYSGCNVTFRKETLQYVGGFDGRLGRTGTQLGCFEETVVIYRIKSIGGTLVYEPTVRVEHLVGSERMTWTYFKRLVLGQGGSLAMLEMEGEVTSHLIPLLSRLGLRRVFKGFFDKYHQPTRIVLIEQEAPPSKWLKLILIDFLILVASTFKLLIIHIIVNDAYLQKAGQASVLTAYSRALHRWKNLWNRMIPTSSIIRGSDQEPPAP